MAALTGAVAALAAIGLVTGPLAAGLALLASPIGVLIAGAAGLTAVITGNELALASFGAELSLLAKGQQYQDFIASLNGVSAAVLGLFGVTAIDDSAAAMARPSTR